MAGRKAADRQACLQLSRRRPPGRPYTHHMGIMAAVDYCRPLRARRSTITTHTHPKQRVSRAEDGHDGRDGPRRDGLGTPCDAPRLTVLRASQQQECIHTSSSCKQICRNRASQPESSAAAQQCCSGGCLAGGGGKRSAQPPVLQQHYSQHPSFADTTRRTPAGQHVAYLSLGEAVGYHY